MTRPPTLKSAMTPFPYAVSPEAVVERAQQLMDEHGAHHLPVTVEHRVVGVVTPHDIMKARLGLERDAALTVDECYVRDVYVVDLNEPLETVLLAMAERSLGSAIVTRQGRLAGVFTALDACQCFGEYLAENFPHGGGNEAA